MDTRILTWHKIIYERTFAECLNSKIKSEDSGYNKEISDVIIQLTSLCVSASDIQTKQWEQSVHNDAH